MQSSSQIITTNKPTSSFLQAGCPSCRPTNSVKALKGKISHSMDLLTTSSPEWMLNVHYVCVQLYLWCVLLVSAFLLSPWRHTKFDGYWSCQPIYRCVLLLESTFFACILCCMYYPHSLSDFFVKWVFVIQSLLLVSVVTLWLVLVIERSQVHTSAELLWCNKHALVPVWVSTGWAKINPTVLESR